ncbi:hypothetical protein ACW4TU_06760 [Streptomyces sp. QTS52]
MDLPALGLALLPPAPAFLLLSLVKPLSVDRHVLFGRTGTALLVGTRDRRPRGRPLSVQQGGPAGSVDDVSAVAQSGRQLGANGDGVLRHAVPAPGVVAGRSGLPPGAARPRPGGLPGPPDPPAHAARDEGAPAPAVRAPSAREPAREAVEREMPATHFEECGTRQVKGALVTVFARPGRC